MDMKFSITHIKRPVRVFPVDLSYSTTTTNIKKTYEIEWINNGNVETSNFETADVILFKGGVDINPAYYGETPNKYCQTPFENRDKYEFFTFNKAVRQNKIIVGICRGAQLLNVANGGKLIQHCGHHYGNHKIKTFDGKEFNTNSFHLQICWPYNIKEKGAFQILAYSKPSFFVNKRIEYISEHNLNFVIPETFQQLAEVDFVEPELIWFPETNSLGIQGHPEISGCDPNYINYINSFLLTKIIQHKNESTKNRNRSVEKQ
jgi:GMP synthase-like glutamine amidotransferase